MKELDPPTRRHINGLKFIDDDDEGESSPIYTHQRTEGNRGRIDLSFQTKLAVQNKQKESKGLAEKLILLFEETATGTLVLFMLGFFGLQYAVFPLLNSLIDSPLLGTQEVWFSVFTLRWTHIEYVWTWVFSVFSHGGTLHLVVNTIAFLSFGLMIEKYFSQREYFTFFVGSGIIAGVMQAFVFSILNTASAPILGASGAIAAIIGVFAIKKPNEKLYFLFIIPMPVWIGISLFIGLSLGLIMFFGLGAFGIAHTAHLTGLFIGLGYGLYKFGLPTPRIGDMITMP